MKNLKYCFCCILVTVLLLAESEGCRERERIGLLQLKSFFNELEWVDDNNSASDCCKWGRVECSIASKRVIGLTLNFSREWNGMADLNASLFLPFQELKTLYLPGNQIAGFLDLHRENLSSVWQNLEFLDLTQNFFEDRDLSYLSELSSLKILDLSFNNIETFRYFQERKSQRIMNLESLNLRYNRLKNTSLEYIGGLLNLKFLNIGGNYMGSIDIKELNKLTNLKQLDMSSNKLESLGSFHDGERQLKSVNLEELDVSDNFLNNSFLAYLRGLPSLKSLDISGNQLKGSINIKELDVFNKLEELDISRNELKELVAPKENKSLSKIKIANLNFVFHNETTSLPHTLELFSSAKTLFLRGNHFNRTISSAQVSEFHASNNIEVLWLDYSYLYNIDILESIGVLGSLKLLSLFDCKLTGTLPPQGWCDLRNLEVLDVGGNALEGTLPLCLSNLSSLTYLDISHNQFTGNGPSTSIANLTLLRFVSLSGNLFHVPSFLSSFANCSDLKVLVSNENKLVKEPSSQTWVPKFQLKAFRMSNCSPKDPYNEVPKFLNYQYDLSILDLSYNNIGGKVPFWFLHNNTRLEAFIMMGNFFSGPLQLPSRSYPNMSFMDISVNKIEGQIPRNICSTFPHLGLFNLSSNALDGEIPPCFGLLNTSLHLDLSYNQLWGRIPEELTKSDSLELLRLSNNNLSGNIPPKIFGIPSLQLLYLDGNNFDGEISGVDISAVNSSSRLVDVDLSNNNLSGKLPRWIWNVTRLVALALSNNQFEGSIPLELCYLDSLEILDISKNNISGAIPSCFDAQSIIHLRLGGNRLSGNLASSFFNSSSLVILDLSENQFTGEIPSWVGALSSLSVLLLKANYLTGKILVHLCESSSLSIIDLSENELSGPIPSCLGTLTFEPNDDKSLTSSYYIGGGADVGFGGFGMTDVELNLRMAYEIYESSSTENHMEVQVDYTTKRSSYTYKGKILDYMSGIDLSCNRLTGQIPNELGNLNQIHSLNLSHNNLTGFIPSSFSKLKQIESLDLSHNNLNGTIPDQLMELNALAIFNVSYNNLSGSIPDQKAQFGTFDESSYMGNPSLCGPPLHKSCTKTDSPPTIQKASEGEEESGLVDERVFLVTFLVCYCAVLMGITAALYLNPYRRRLWFYFIEEVIDTCRYFIEGTFLKLSIVRRT